MTAPWLTILGIGDNGLAGLTPVQQALLDKAETVIAPQRVLAALDLAGKRMEPWAGKLQEAVDALIKRRGEQIVVLATGDPMHFGVGATLAKRIPADEMTVIPSPSAFSLAAARLGWALQDCACISLHGRPVEKVLVHLAPGRRIIALTSDRTTMTKVSELLCDGGFGKSLVTVLEHMGGEKERIDHFIAEEFGAGLPDCDFYTLAIECSGDPPVASGGRVAGLPDEMFIHDGQITKREIRAVTLSQLRPYPDAMLWDIGAGCGSVAIEWMRAAINAKAVAIERHRERLSFIATNADSLGVPDLQIAEGSAPDALAGLPAPDAVFCGGGITGEGVFETAWEALRPGGRFVANVVTLDGEAKLLSLHENHGGDLLRLSVSRAQPVGRFSGWKPFMPVTIWSTRK